jgi:phosphatidate cytidylyltransferase
MLKQRIITASILAPLMIVGVFALPFQYFSFFIAIIVMFGAWEWSNIAGYTKPIQRIGYAILTGCLILSCMMWLNTVDYLDQITLFTYVLLSSLIWWVMSFFAVIFYPKTGGILKISLISLLLGWFILLPMWVGFMVLKLHGAVWILCVLLLIWGADIGAYFSGRKWGKLKLAPQVSPGKSWAGFFGGVLTSMIIMIMFFFFFNSDNSMGASQWISWLLVGLVTALASVLGDLVESMFKRIRGIKDSSQLLPGHGGVLDRIDSMASAVPIFALALSMGVLF